MAGISHITCDAPSRSSYPSITPRINRYRINRSPFAGINLIIGPNQSGKTFLLKALYAALKTVEQHRRGKENRTDKEILSDKLYWTFQTKSDLPSVRQDNGNADPEKISQWFAVKALDASVKN